MRFGALRSGAMFVTAFAALFAAMSVGAPAAKSQAGLLQRMTFMHQNPQLHFSLVDPTKPPTPAATEAVGEFLGASAQSSQLVEGHPYPNHIDPDYLYGITKDGFTIRRVGQTGTQIDTTNLGNLFTRTTGAWLVTNNVPMSPQWIPRAYDLREHFVIVGELNQANASLQGNSTGMMLVNPKTMSGYTVANAPMFLGPTAANMFEDVCFGVYPGPDADYATIDDNQYRYVVFMSTDGTDDHSVACLSLNKHETMDGLDPSDPDWIWNPVVQERGPQYTNVYPVVTANPGWAIQPVLCEQNGQNFLRSYYARPELALSGTFGAPTDVTYVVSGYVVLVQTNPNYWGCFVSAYSLGQTNPLATTTSQNVRIGYSTTGPISWPTDDIFKGMTIVGDWMICSIGDGNSGDGFADYFAPIYLPELVDGIGDFDSGAVMTSSLGPGTAGYAGYHPNINGHPVITYIGSGAGQSIVQGTTRNPFSDHPRGQGLAGLLAGGMTNIDMHTEEEKLLGLNFRRAPQPFVGFWFSEDPAANFPGFRDGSGGGDGSGGCSGSTGGGAGTSAGLLGIVGVVFLLTQVLRESRRA